MLAEAGSTVLGEAIAQVQADIDSVFDALLPVPDDTSARLVEAMRYAAIGGGKRVRPLLVCSTAALFGVAGAFLAVPVVALLLALLDIYGKRYDLVAESPGPDKPDDEPPADRDSASAGASTSE